MQNKSSKIKDNLLFHKTIIFLDKFLYVNPVANKIAGLKKPVAAKGLKRHLIALQTPKSFSCKSAKFLVVLFNEASYREKKYTNFHY